MLYLDKKAIVVTGAGRGIGAAIARHAAAAGGLVVVNDLDGDKAADVAAQIAGEGGTAFAFAADIADWDQAAALIASCRQRFGRIDGLVNNAALFSLGRAEELREQDVRRLLDVNVAGTIFCGTHAARVMVEQGGGGALVNVTSGAQMGLPHQGLYGATKGAVASLVYTWAMELEGLGIRVNGISPLGATRMVESRAAYMRERFGEPGPVRQSPAWNAPLATFLLSDVSAPMTGQIVRVDGKELSIYAHPAIVSPAAESARWDVEDIRRAFAEHLGAQLQPLGVRKVALPNFGI